MADPTGLSNLQIAEIYENMMSGDRSVLFRLQNIVTNNIHKYADIKNQNKAKPDQLQTPKVVLSSSKVEPSFKEVNSVPAMQAGKEQLFLNAIKRGVNIESQESRSEKKRPQAKNFKRIVNSSNQIYAAQSKKNKSLFKELQSDKQIQVNIVQLQKPLPNNNKVYALPRLQKGRQPAQIGQVNAQSTQEELGKKNISLQNINKPKVVSRKQRADFKQIINRNKQMKQEFQKKNQQERQLQIDIVKHHQQTKQYLQGIISKFQLNLNHIPKYLKRKQKIESPASPQIKQSQSQKKISPFRAAMKNQAQHCAQMSHQIAHLQSLFSSNAAKIKHLQEERQSYLFVRYLDRYGLEIQQEAEEENDTVEPLIQQEEPHNKNRYRYSMARTRQKKWSLVQRTEYEANRTHSLEESRQANTTSRISQPTQDSSNKVTVNERLKNLLFS